MTINWTDIETKWRNKWQENKDFETNPNDKPKKFITVAYPYPNSPQHIGHGRTYTLADVHARFYRMKGYNVLFPMGFHYTGTPVLGMAKRIEAGEKEILDGLRNIYHVPEDAIKSCIKKLRKLEIGEEKITFRIRDWGVSRQRYWGCPIPIIFCKNCGEVPVPEEHLPITLPEEINFNMKGNPLDNHPTWKYTLCPKCNKEAKAR